MKKFTEAHQAMLFAYLSRAVIESIGEKEGEPIIRKGVIKYGMQRGRRMALRAKSYGHPLTMDNYIAYVEWKPSKGKMESKLLEKSPNSRLHVYKCPWHTAWEKSDLMRYGKYFCMEVDEALVKGFNENLRIDVNGTRPNGAKHCDFVFYDTYLKGFNLLKLITKKMIRPGKKAIMSWEYHCGNLYKTIREVIIEEIGDNANSILNRALEDFANEYDEESVNVITSYKDTNFNEVPEE
jgi:hypothetical protein